MREVLSRLSYSCFPIQDQSPYPVLLRSLPICACPSSICEPSIPSITYSLLNYRVRPAVLAQPLAPARLTYSSQAASV